MLKFKKASERVSSLKTIGTVASFIGKDGKYELTSSKNFKGEINKNGVRVFKKVSIKLMDKNGDYEFVNCSKPVGDYLREATTESDLKARLAELGSLPILELPQTITDENDPKFGQPYMVVNEETGEEEQLVLYSISFTGATDMSATSIAITDEMLNKEIASRAIKFEDLIAL